MIIFSLNNIIFKASCISIYIVVYKPLCLFNHVTPLIQMFNLSLTLSLRETCYTPLNINNDKQYNSRCDINIHYFNSYVSLNNTISKRIIIDINL